MERPKFRVIVAPARDSLSSLSSLSILPQTSLDEPPAKMEAQALAERSVVLCTALLL